MAIASIAITNLNKYVCGCLDFVWLDVPFTDEELDEALDKIEVSHGDKHYFYCGNESEELFLTDWECEYNLQISEYCSLERLNEQAEKLEELDDEQREIVQALLDNSFDLDDAIEEAENGIFYEGCDDMSDVAMKELDDDSSIPEYIRCYIDYQSYGEMLDSEGQYYPTTNGYFLVCG